MKITENKTAQNLLDAFSQFHSLKWKQSPTKDLKSSEFHVLFILKQRTDPEKTGLKVSEISKMLRIAPPSVTQVINGLEASGYVERTMDKDDRRAVRVKLSEKGETVINKASDHFTASFIGLADYLGDEKSQELTELLSLVFTYFKDKKDENK